MRAQFFLVDVLGDAIGGTDYKLIWNRIRVYHLRAGS